MFSGWWSLFSTLFWLGSWPIVAVDSFHGNASMPSSRTSVLESRFGNQFRSSLISGAGVQTSPMDTWSFTQELLTWANVYQQVPAENPGAAAPALTAQQQFAQDVEQAVAQGDGDVGALLTQHADARLVYIYRPSPPPANRIIVFGLRILPTTTEATLRRRIYHFWEDLLHANWRIIPVHPTVLTSQHTRGIHHVYVLEADIDLHEHEVVILHEFQSWDLNTARYQGTLVPKCWGPSLDGHELVHLTRPCWRQPCPALVNGQQPDMASTIFFRTGDYVLSTVATPVRLVHPVLAPLQIMGDPDAQIPAAFSRQVATAMRRWSSSPAASSVDIALRFQRMHSRFYIEALMLTRAHLVDKHSVLLIQPEREHGRLRPLAARHHHLQMLLTPEDDMPTFLRSLLEYEIRRNFWRWNLAPIHAAVHDLRLPAAQQYFGIREPFVSDLFGQSRFVVAQVLLESPQPGTGAFVDYINELLIVYLDDLTAPRDWLVALNLLQDCLEQDCLLEFNHRILPLDAPAQPVVDGSVLRIWVFTSTDAAREASSHSSEVVDADSVPSASAHTPESITTATHFPSRSSECSDGPSRSASPHPPPGGFLHMPILLSAFWIWRWPPGRSASWPTRTRKFLRPSFHSPVGCCNNPVSS